MFAKKQNDKMHSYKHHPPAEKLEYNYIKDGIYIGTNKCCQSHFNEILLKKENITADISLEKKEIDQPYGVKYYAWTPIKDHTAPTQKQIDYFVTILEILIKMNEKVYVHCQNGHSRAPTMVAAYFMNKEKVTFMEAEKIIKTKRPSIHIESSQKKALKFYQKRLNVK